MKAILRWCLRLYLFWVVFFLLQQTAFLSFNYYRLQAIPWPEILLAYWYAFTRRPELWGWEVGGLMAGLWFVWRHQLYRPSRLKQLVITGRAS